MRRASGRRRSSVRSGGAPTGETRLRRLAAKRWCWGGPVRIRNGRPLFSSIRSDWSGAGRSARPRSCDRARAEIFRSRIQHRDLLLGDVSRGRSGLREFLVASQRRCEGEERAEVSVPAVVADSESEVATQPGDGAFDDPPVPTGCWLPRPRPSTGSPHGRTEHGFSSPTCPYRPDWIRSAGPLFARTDAPSTTTRDQSSKPSEPSSSSTAL